MGAAVLLSCTGSTREHFLVGALPIGWWFLRVMTGSGRPAPLRHRRTVTLLA